MGNERHILTVVIHLLHVQRNVLNFLSVSVTPMILHCAQILHQDAQMSWLSRMTCLKRLMSFKWMIMGLIFSYWHFQSIFAILYSCSYYVDLVSSYLPPVCSACVFQIYKQASASVFVERISCILSIYQRLLRRTFYTSLSCSLQDQVSCCFLWISVGSCSRKEWRPHWYTWSDVYCNNGFGFNVSFHTSVL